MDVFRLFDQTCEHLKDPNPWTVALAVFIAVGILVSYVPQHAKIVMKGTSEGLSPWFILLGGLSTVAAIGNILCLPASREDMKCCKNIGLGNCIAALLGVVQIGTQFTCFMLIVMLFLAYSTTSSLSEDAMTASVGSLTRKSDTHTNAVIVSSTILAASLVTLVVSTILVSAFPNHTQTWADILGTVSGVLAAIQYLPQIYYTYQLGDIKSLSMITMLMQVPGAFLFALSLWLRVGWEGWSAWMVYVVTGVLQGVLFGIAIAYMIRDRNAAKAAASETPSSTEETPLLNDR